jgi:hypothetical protein
VGKNLGKNNCFCLNSGSFGANKFVPIISARDIKVARKPAASFDSTDRTTQISTVIPVRQSAEVTLSAIWNGGAGLTALRNAWLNGTVLSAAAYLEGPPATGAYGLIGDWIVSKFPIKQPLAGGQMIDITLQPAANYVNRVQIFTDATSGTLGTAETQVNKKVGFIASVNTTGGTPVPTARDISWSLEWQLEEASDRAQEEDGNGIAFQQYLCCLPKVSAEFEVIWNNAVHSAFRTAYDSGNPITLYFLDGPYATSGSWGPYTDWAITDFPVDAPLLDGQKVKMKFEPHGLATNLFQYRTS